MLVTPHFETVTFCWFAPAGPTLGFNPGNPINTLKENKIEYAQHKSVRQDVFVDLAVSAQPLNTMINTWYSSFKSNFEPTTLLTLSNAQADEITQGVRNLLKKEGVLSQQTKTVRVLSTAGLTDAQKKHTKFYNVGDRITFNAFTKEQKHYEVGEVQKDGLILINSYGQKSLFKPEEKHDFNVSRVKEIELSVGDFITNNRATFINRLKFEKGSSFKVKAITEDNVVLEAGNKSISLDNKALSRNYISYDYCKKLNQLTKEDNQILVAALPYQLNSNLMGEITEFSKNVRLFTNNFNKASNYLDKEQVKWTALDVANKKPDLIYRNIQSAPSILEKDLNHLVAALELNENVSKTDVAKLAVSYAVSKCSEKQAAFKHSDLMTHALKYALGKADFEDIAPVLKERIKGENLVHLGTFWTTKDALKLEQDIISSNYKEQGRVEPIELNNSRLLSLPKHLTQGQKDAISLATTSKDRFISVQGLAGVGKTTMMKEIQAIANENQYRVIGLAPTHQAKDQLNDSNISSMTVESFLTHENPIDEKTIMIVDESSMLDNNTYHQLQNRAIKANSRVIFSGDITQLQSLSSGIPHELTINSGSQKTAYMQEIIRQNPNPTLKKAAEFASVRKIGKAFGELDKINPEKYIERAKAFTEKHSSFIEIKCDDQDGEKNYSPIYQAVAEDYLSRTQNCQRDTIVVVHAHRDRAVIDQKIRQGLQEQGQISKEETGIERLVSKPFDLADSIDVSKFEQGDILRFGKSYHFGKRGEYFTVESINKDKNSMKCISQDNISFNIKASTLLKGKVSAYTKDEAYLSKGDRVRLKLSDENRGLIANKEYEVVSIIDGIAELQNEKEKTTLNLNNKQDQHWDYAYTNTAYSTQGATTKLFIGLELSDRLMVTTHRSNEIDITRASHQATIYTDDKAGLISRLENPLKQHDVDKRSALVQKHKFNQEQNNLKAISDKLSHYKKNENSSHTPIPHSKTKPFIDADDVLKNLNAQSEHLVKHLLGEPNRRLSNKHQYRYGAKGSLTVNLSNGLWHSFESGEGGNLFSLIEQEKGLSSFKEVLDFAVDFIKYKPRGIPEKNPLEHQLETKKDNGLRDVANKLYNQSKPVQGSVVEKYLTVHRGLYQFSNADIKYCPSVYSKQDDKNIYTPAMLAFSRNQKGEINHVQVTKLDINTANKNKLVESNKQTFGKIDGHAINLNRKGEGDTTYLVEGVETGLSILEIKPKARVFAVLSKSNFTNINLNQLTKNVIICVDNDGQSTFKYNKRRTNNILSAVERFQENDINTSILLPENVCEDLNDILNKKGKKALSDLLNNKIKPEDFKNICEKESNIITINQKISPEEIKNISPKDSKTLVQNEQIEKPNSNFKSRINEINSKNINQELDNNKLKDKHIIANREMEKEL